MKKLFILIIVTLFFSCDDTEVKNQATMLDINEIANTTGFETFSVEYADYDPDNTIVQEIQSEYQSGEEKIILFVKRSCICEGTKFLFPHLMKSMAISNINNSDIEVFAASSESDEHPYQDMIQIDDLPAAFVIRNNNVDYSIFDEYNSKIANQDTVLIESVLLESLRN